MFDLDDMTPFLRIEHGAVMTVYVGIGIGPMYETSLTVFLRYGTDYGKNEVAKKVLTGVLEAMKRALGGPLVELSVAVEQLETSSVWKKEIDRVTSELLVGRVMRS